MTRSDTPGSRKGSVLKGKACQLYARSKERLCGNSNHTINSSTILNFKTIPTGEVGFVASRRALFFVQHPFCMISFVHYLAAQGQVAGAGGQPRRFLGLYSLQGLSQSGRPGGYISRFIRREGTTPSQDSSTHLRSRIR